jgi:hypothetical protein
MTLPMVHHINKEQVLLNFIWGMNLVIFPIPIFLYILPHTSTFLITGENILSVWNVGNEVNSHAFKILLKFLFWPTRKKRKMNSRCALK